MNLYNLRIKLNSPKVALKVRSAVMLVLIGTLVSCGYDKSSTQGNETLSFSTSALKGGRDLTDGEIAIALRVCYAFRTKRSNFSVEMIGNTFNFNYMTKDCQGKEDQSTFSGQLSQQTSTNSLRYTSSFTGPYISEVQTDLNGYLKNLCSAVLAGETPLNSENVNNELYEYHFQSSVVYAGDTVTITIGSKQSPTDSNPTVSQKVILDVLTNSTSSGSYQGMVTEATRYLPCAATDSRPSKSYKQIFQAP